MGVSHLLHKAGYLVPTALPGNTFARIAQDFLIISFPRLCLGMHSEIRKSEIGIYLEFEIWNLFVIWDLRFGIYFGSHFQN